jgi:hypothetical protein
LLTENIWKRLGAFRLINFLLTAFSGITLLLAIGIAVGLLGSWGLTRAISSQLYGVSTTDCRRSFTLLE